MRFVRGLRVALTCAVMAGGLITATSGSASAAQVAPERVPAGALITATSDPASATEVAPQRQFSPNCIVDDVPVYNGSVLAGYALWNANPSDCANGDNLGADDVSADGYSVVAHLHKPDGSVPDRVVSTSGHDAPWTEWKGGNLPEGAPYWMWACLSKDGVESQCSGAYIVYA